MFYQSQFFESQIRVSLITVEQFVWVWHIISWTQKRSDSQRIENKRKFFQLSQITSHLYLLSRFKLIWKLFVKNSQTLYSSCESQVVTRSVYSGRLFLTAFLKSFSVFFKNLFVRVWLDFESIAKLIFCFGPEYGTNFLFWLKSNHSIRSRFWLSIHLTLQLKWYDWLETVHKY